MEVHSVLPEERATDANGQPLPWGYRYLDSSRNTRAPPEESGPFGKNRTSRYTGSRSRTRTGTTPVRQKENATVAEFGRLLSKEQKDEEERRAKNTILDTSSGETPKLLSPPKAVATECLLYGYASKSSEWRVLSKFERIVAPSYICEDYSREDPNLALTSSRISSNSATIHRNLSKDALKKSRSYKGGNHWIKVTFDNHQAAERACYYSPQEVEGHLVFCEMWQGRGPFSDAPLLKGSHSAKEHQRNAANKIRTLTTSQTTEIQSGMDSAIAGFERATKTLPRGFTPQDTQYGKLKSKDDTALAAPAPQSVESSSATASSATATGFDPWIPPLDQLRTRSVPSLPLSNTTTSLSVPSEYMTHIPTVRRAILRPASEALLPQPSFPRRWGRYLRGWLLWIPVISWLVTAISYSDSDGMIGDGPILNPEGKFDRGRNGWYWTFWNLVDRGVGTDFCGLAED